MRAVPNIFIFLVASLHCASSEEMHRTVDLQNTCAGSYNTDEAVSSHTLYNQVYQWTHQHDVKHWAYEPSQPSPAMRGYFRDGATLECATVHYDGDVDLPEGFAAFLNTFNIEAKLQIRVKKEVCLDPGRALAEITTVSQHVVGDVHIETRSEFQDPGTMNTTSYVQLDVPWYAAFLRDRILYSLAQSVREKVDVVSKSLCRPRTTLLRRMASRDIRRLRPARPNATAFASNPIS